MFDISKGVCSKKSQTSLTHFPATQKQTFEKRGVFLTCKKMASFFTQRYRDREERAKREKANERKNEWRKKKDYNMSIEGKYSQWKYMINQKYNGTQCMMGKEEYGAVLSRKCVFCGFGMSTIVEVLDWSEPPVASNCVGCCKNCMYKKRSNKRKNYDLREFGILTNDHLSSLILTVDVEREKEKLEREHDLEYWREEAAKRAKITPAEYINECGCSFLWCKRKAVVFEKPTPQLQIQEFTENLEMV